MKKYIFLLLVLSALFISTTSLAMTTLEKEFHRAVSQGNETLTIDALEKKVDVNAQDKYGDTALIIATTENNLRIVNLLVKRGADVNIRNTFDFTALMKATVRANIPIVKTLLGAGAIASSTNTNEQTALSIARGLHETEIVLLLEKQISKQ